ncbi:hypothetical protein [Microbacterium lacticum]
MGDVEHVAGVLAFRREEAFVGGMCEHRVDQCVGPRHRHAELRERAAGRAIEPVDGEEHPGLGAP